MDLSAFPRARLCRLPTPLEPLDALSRVLGGPRLFIKRDDMTGIALGGNKARQLEFYLGEALARGADTIITTGAIQSNHACMTAAAAAQLGLACHIQLESRVPGKGPEYARTGNALLDRVFGAELHFFAEGEDEKAADAALDAIARKVRQQGGKPFVIHLGMDHAPLGALGYIDAAGEMADQATNDGFRLDALVVASGSGSTHGGLLVGLRARGQETRVYGSCVRRDEEAQKARVIQRLEDIGNLVGKPGLTTVDDVWLTDKYMGAGYGQPSAGMMEAISLLARHEGLLLDPVYTGKGMAALIGLVRQGEFGKDENVVFLHTGGLPAVFAYNDLLADL